MKKIIFLLLVISILLTACGPEISGEERLGQGNFIYEMVEIEGMTCIWYEKVSGYSGYAGLTCNWEEYQQ